MGWVELTRQVTIVAAGRQRDRASGLVDEHIDVERAADALRHRGGQAVGVAAEGGDAGVCVFHGAQQRGATGDEGGIAREVDHVGPVSGAGPDRRGTVVGHGVVHRQRIAAVHRGGQRNVAEHQVGHAAGDVGLRLAGGAAGRVEVAAERSDDDEPGAARCGVEQHGLRVGVALAGIERAQRRVAAECPDAGGSRQRGRVGEIDRVRPRTVGIAGGNARAGIGHCPAEAEILGGLPRWIRGDSHDRDIRQRRRRHRREADDLGAAGGGVAGLVVVVLDLVGIVWVDVGGKLALDQRGVRIDPDREVVGAGNQTRRQGDGDRLVVAGAAGEDTAVVLHFGQQNVAEARVRPLLVNVEPNLLGEAAKVGGAGAEVGDSEIHCHLVAGEGQRRGRNVADHEVGERRRGDVDLLDGDVVGPVGELIDRAAHVGFNDDIDVAGIPQRHHEAGGVVGIRFARCQRRHVLQ